MMHPQKFSRSWLLHFRRSKDSQTDSPQSGSEKFPSARSSTTSTTTSTATSTTATEPAATQQTHQIAKALPRQTRRTSLSRGPTVQRSVSSRLYNDLPQFHQGLIQEPDGEALAAFLHPLCRASSMPSSVSPRQYQPPSSPFRLPHDPPVPLGTFGARLGKYFHCSQHCVGVAAALLLRVNMRRPDLFDKRSGHKLLLAALTIAAKMSEDKTCTQGHYASCGGIEVSELNTLEFEFLTLLDFNAFVTPTQLRQAWHAVRHQRSWLAKSTSLC